MRKIPSLTPYIQQAIYPAPDIDDRSDAGVEHRRLGLVNLAIQTRKYPYSVHRTMRAVLDDLWKSGILESDCYAKAARLIARRIDEDAAARSDLPAYHNPPHFLDAGLAAAVMGVRAYKYPGEFNVPDPLIPQVKLRMLPEDVGDMLVAGLIHDLGHPGGGNGEKEVNGKKQYQYCRLESRSWRLAKSLLMQTRYKEHPQRLARLYVMILATDPRVGPQLADLALRYHQALDKSKKENFRREA